MGSFGSILASGVFVKVIEPATPSVSPLPSFIHWWAEFDKKKKTYVRPRCDEIHFRRQRPISRSFSDGVGLRHSFSRSCIHQPSTILSNPAQHEKPSLRKTDTTYLYPEILIDFHNLAEHRNILHQIGKLPAIPQSMKRPRLLLSLFLFSILALLLRLRRLLLLLFLLLRRRSLRLGIVAPSRYHCGDLVGWVQFSHASTKAGFLSISCVLCPDA